MIAPCGMNCSLCIGHLREKKKCTGCLGHDRDKPEYCRSCKVVVCEKRKTLPSQMCYECPKFPLPTSIGYRTASGSKACARIKQLDKRYREKYGMSMIENLLYIKENGMDAFLAHEEKRWACPDCGTTLSVHRAECLKCGKERIIESYKLN